LQDRGLAVVLLLLDSKMAILLPVLEQVVEQMDKA
jgi:hypothetical protein